MKIIVCSALVWLSLAAPVCAAAADEALTVTVHAITAQGVGAAQGSVRLTPHDTGVLIEPSLSGLPPGLHGFHLHEQPDCGPGSKDGGAPQAGLAAGSHFDPEQTGAHEGPYGEGHAGDLPALFVQADGTATLPLLAPRLDLADFRGRALVIHAGADNYSDQPAALGGGAGRIACGAIPAAP